MQHASSLANTANRLEKAGKQTAALLLDIEPLKLVHGPGAVLGDYVNDRPYVASSFLSVAISQVLGHRAGRPLEGTPRAGPQRRYR